MTYGRLRRFSDLDDAVVEQQTHIVVALAITDCIDDGATAQRAHKGSRPSRSPCERMSGCSHRTRDGGRGGQAPSQARIARDECCVQTFGERCIEGVVGRADVAKLPRASQQRGVGVASDREIGKFNPASVGRDEIDLARAEQAAECLGDFDVHQRG